MATRNSFAIDLRTLLSQDARAARDEFGGEHTETFSASMANLVHSDGPALPLMM